MERADDRSKGRQQPGLRIAVAIGTLDTLGGKERDALAIAGGLAARGHDVTILTRSAGLQIPSDITVRQTGTKGWTNHGQAQHFARAVAALRGTGHFDAVLSFDKLRDADAYYAADVCFVERMQGLKTWLPRYASYANLESECFGAGGPDILFLCRKAANEYRRHYNFDADRAVVLPPMIHDSGRQNFYERREAIRQSLGIPVHAMLAASVAVYPRQKGVDRTVAALRNIPELHLLAAGLKDITSVNASAVKYGLEARTHFLGYRNDIADLLGAADLMLHPARVENTGLVILESLLAGVPVVASAACGFAEYIERFGAGIIVGEPFDTDEYVAAIRTAIEPNMLAALRDRARTSASQLRAEGGLDRILDVVEQILKRHRRRTGAAA